MVDDSAVIQLGVGGIFAVLVIRMVLEHLKNTKLTESAIDMERQIHDLWVWHNVTDPSTGMKSWYTSRESSEIMSGMKASLDNNTEAIRELTHKMETVSIKVDSISG